jgi:hypothetical protein
MVVTTTQCPGLVLTEREEKNSVAVSIASPAHISVRASRRFGARHHIAPRT